METGTRKLRYVVSDVIWLCPRRQRPGKRDDEDLVLRPEGSIACRPEQNLMPNTKPPE